MKISLKFKLIFYIILVVTVEGAVLGFSMLFLMSQTAIHNTIEHTKLITAVTSDNLAVFLKNRDKNAILDRLIALKGHNIILLQVYIDNTLFEGVQNDDRDIQRAKAYIDPATNRLKYVQTGEMLVFSSPVYYSGRKAGTFILGYSLKEYNEQTIRNSVLTSMIEAVILFAAVLISLFFVGSIVKSIKTLEKYARRISEGDLSLESIKRAGRDEISSLFASFNAMNDNLKEIISKVTDITMNLNSTSKEIEAAAQEQTTGASEHASGITEVSATLEELTITAKQITKNAGELLVASEEAVMLLKSGESRLTQALEQIKEVGSISRTNTTKIGELGKRSELIGEMVEIIKDVSNKTNMLSINASIEASRAGEAGKGFSVVAAEIRELSKETLASARKVGEAGIQIQDYLHEIVISSESESQKVLESVNIVKSMADSLEAIIDKIRDNTEFTQKIDISIKQQENGSNQASETIKQMAEIARQSAEASRQTLRAVQDIVGFSNALNASVQRFKLAKKKYNIGLSAETKP